MAQALSERTSLFHDSDFFFDVDLFFLKIVYWICYSVASVYVLVSLIIESYGILASQAGIEAAPRALKIEVLTTGPPGKSPRDCVGGIQLW